MVVNVSLKREYIPEWNENKLSDKPIRVIHKAPTIALAEKLIPKPRIKMRIEDDGARGGETEIVVDNTAIVKEMVSEIIDCELNIDGRTVVIKTSDDLYGPNTPIVLMGLIDELGKYFQGLLAERSVDTKN